MDVIENWRAGATDQVTRLDRLVDSILASVRGEGLTGLRREPFDVVFAIDRTVGNAGAAAPDAGRALDATRARAGGPW